MATGPRPTYFLSAGYIRVSYGLNGPPAGVLRLHRRANTRNFLGQGFECVPTCLLANRTCVQLWASPGEIRVKY